jgi:hypothetical protein
MSLCGASDTVVERRAGKTIPVAMQRLCYTAARGLPGENQTKRTIFPFPIIGGCTKSLRDSFGLTMLVRLERILWCAALGSLPYTFFLLNGDMELNKNRQIFVNKML